MCYMAITVNHDVAIMPVFDLQNVAEHRVGCHGLHKVVACLLELDGAFGSETGMKEAWQIVDFCATHFIS